MAGVIDTMMEQSFAARFQRMENRAEEQHNSQGIIRTVLDQSFTAASQRVGAGSLSLIPTGLPERVLDYNATANQPNNAPKPAG